AYKDYEMYFRVIEVIAATLFSIEYILRFWTAKKRLKYVFSLMSFIDILAILPSAFAYGDFRFLRVFRVFRIFRFTRFFEHHNFFFGEITRTHLHISRIAFVIIAIIFVDAGLIYNIERDANPEMFSSFFDAVYFSIVTITTTGFGDITPISFYGKLATIFIIILGIILIPWEVGNLIKEAIIGNKKQIVCQKCGLKSHDKDAVHCKHCGSIIYQEIE
ncbi:potassium channel family protein, partial [candidate division KSB1 bacterium]